MARLAPDFSTFTAWEIVQRDMWLPYSKLWLRDWDVIKHMCSTRRGSAITAPIIFPVAQFQSIVGSGLEQQNSVGLNNGQLVLCVVGRCSSAHCRYKNLSS